MADQRYFDLQIITPERIFYQEKAVMVEMNTKEGAIGVYPMHVPTTTILAPGMLTIHLENGQTKVAALHGGFAEIQKTKVTVLAEAAEWPGEIDVDRAKAARERAERILRGGDQNMDMMRAELALRRALTRIKVSGH